MYRHGLDLSKRTVASLRPFQLPRWPVLSVVGAGRHGAGPLGSPDYISGEARLLAPPLGFGSPTNSIRIRATHVRIGVRGRSRAELGTGSAGTRTLGSVFLLTFDPTI